MEKQREKAKQRLSYRPGTPSNSGKGPGAVSKMGMEAGTVAVTKDGHWRIGAVVEEVLGA